MNQQSFQTPPRTKAINGGQAQYLRSIDKSIRKKWNQLYFCRKSKMGQQKEDAIKVKKLYTQPVEIKEVDVRLNAHAIQVFKSNHKRELVHERNRKNNDIFYRKRATCPETSKKAERASLREERIKSQSSAQIRASHSHEKQRKQMRGQKLPLMLQRRTKKFQKEMSIIEYLSQKSIKTLNIKTEKKEELKQQKKEKLLQSFKGTKLYYQFIKQWVMPRY